MRSIVLESLYSKNSNFTNISCKALFLYIMSMCDEIMINLSASYIENILNCCKPNSNYIVDVTFFLSLLLFYFVSFAIVLTVLVLKSSCRKGALIFPGFGGGAGKAREQHPEQKSWAGTRLCFTVVRVRVTNPDPKFY